MRKGLTASLFLIVLMGCATPKSEVYPWLRSDLSVEDKRKALHEELRTPEKNNHDAFIYLTTLGNKDSVPLIIKAFRWQPKPLINKKGEKSYECTVGHCWEALHSLTGEDFGNDAERWDQWWKDVGSSLPTEHFKPRISQPPVAASSSRGP